MTRLSRCPLPFECIEDAPPPLVVETQRRVRFQEVDPLGIVWHGHYASYFEDGRTAFGDRFGLRYTQMRDAGFAAPIVQMTTQFLAPLEFDQTFSIRTSAHWSEAARLHFEYMILRDESTVAHGASVQALIDLEGDLLLTWPSFMEDFREKWRKGKLQA